jgi:hypothetical protein
MNSVKRVALVFALCAASLQVSAEDRPNIVMIFADDLGTGDLACYGHPYAVTPNIDRIAKEGTRFTRYYATGVTCCPSRTGFMTSRHPASFENYMSAYGFGDRITVTELLRDNGYATGHFGKWHIGPEKPGRANGVYGIDEVGIIGNSERPDAGRTTICSTPRSASSSGIATVSLSTSTSGDTLRITRSNQATTLTISSATWRSMNRASTPGWPTSSKTRGITAST